MKSIFASDLLPKHATNNGYIVSFCSVLDQMLGGGFPLGHVIQVAGQSGSGKTQLCFQLCLNVQIPSCLGGIGGSAIFIDVEYTFTSSRVFEMAESVAEYCRVMSTTDFATTTSTGTKHASKIHADDFLSGIYLFRCLDAVQLLATTYQLFEFIKDHTEIKLVVVDSIAHCLRSEENKRTRAKFLNILAENFKKLAFTFNLAVVIVNQVTTNCHSTASVSPLVPALGAVWNYVPSAKIMLVKQNARRLALLYKSIFQPRKVATYQITKDGFRDFENKQNLVFSQATTNEMVHNTHELKTQTSFPEEDIVAKWLTFSQRELNCKSAWHTKMEASYSPSVEHIARTHSDVFLDDISVINTEHFSSLSDNSEPSSPVLTHHDDRRKRKL